MLLRIFLLIFIVSLTPSTFASSKSEWISLLDDNLSQWDNYLSYSFKPGYDGSQPIDSNSKPISPIGENSALADRIFSVVKTNNEPILKISGEIYGALITKQSFRNYHLHMKVRWEEMKWNPRKALLKDSGILYHSVGPHGAEYWRSWMQGQEFQIMEGHMGDYWSQATSAMDVRAYTPEYIMNPIASTTQPFLSVGHKEKIKGLVIRSDNHESPEGEWTSLDLICHEGKSLHIVNNKVVMVLKNSRYEKDEKFIPLDEGKIQLQSEAAEIFYKDIKIKEIDKLPKKYTPLFN